MLHLTRYKTVSRAAFDLVGKQFYSLWIVLQGTHKTCLPTKFQRKGNGKNHEISTCFVSLGNPLVKPCETLMLVWKRHGELSGSFWKQLFLHPPSRLTPQSPMSPISSGTASVDSDVTGSSGRVRFMHLGSRHVVEPFVSGQKINGFQNVSKPCTHQIININVNIIQLDPCRLKCVETWFSDVLISVPSMTPQERLRGSFPPFRITPLRPQPLTLQWPSARRILGDVFKHVQTLPIRIDCLTQQWWIWKAEKRVPNKPICPRIGKKWSRISKSSDVKPSLRNSVNLRLV